MCEISVSDTVMIIGGGMIGLIMLQLAKLSGASRLILLEPVAAKRELAKNLGADLCIDPLHEDVPAILAANNISRIQVVIECVGRPDTMEQAISYAGRSSIVMFFGLTKPQETISVKPFELFKKEIVLKASFINPYTQQRALDLIGSGKIDVSSMVTLKAGLDRLPELLADDTVRKEGKVIICPGLN